jgi:hypothetical protein
MRIEKLGLVRGIAEAYIFDVIPNFDGTNIHVILNKYYRFRRNNPGEKILEDSPRWARNNPAFSNMETVAVPQEIIDEVRQKIIDGIVFHLP